MWTLIFIFIGKALTQECFNGDCSQFNTSQFSTTTEYSEEMSSTVADVPSTLAPTPASPTLPPAFQVTDPGSICLCDLTVNQCDMNCCCDTECSAAIRQIFSHCSHPGSVSDPKTCYSNDFLFRRPSNVLRKEKDGLFCLVRDNLAYKKIFPSHAPVKTLDEFHKLSHKWNRRTHTFHETLDDIFMGKPYRDGDVMWAILNKQIIPLQMAAPVYGELCLGSKPVKFSHDEETSCLLKLPQMEPYCSEAINQFLQKIVKLRIITNPSNFNMTNLINSINNCSSLDACSGFTTYVCTRSSCKKTTKLFSFFKPANCKTLGLELEMRIKHNGTEGLLSAEMFLTPLSNSELKTKVKFMLMGDSEETFDRSGNPGYINGKPILAGKKITLAINDTTTKKEGIEMTVNPSGWLTVLDESKGYCSPLKRQSVLFNTNTKKTCSYLVTNTSFSKTGCIELQKQIYDLLLNESLANVSSDFNLYVGQFGNSRVEIISDWLQVIVDHYDLVSTKPTFENTTGELSCRGLLTHLFIDIAFAKQGSFFNPQSKIGGVLYRFGPSRRVSIRCNSLVCKSESVILKLITDVQFMDLSTSAVAEYAQPPGLEIKFPHDFFYPFFAGAANTNVQKYSIVVMMCVFCFLFM